MLKKDYVLTAVTNCLGEGKDISEIGEWLGLEDTALMAIEEVYTSGNKWGQTLTGHDIVKIYESGLTFSEVSWIKGVTKEAIRLTVDSTIGDRKEEAKEVSKGKRQKMRSIILYEMIVGESNRTSKEEALKKSGYSESMFNQLYRESVRWKEEQEKEENSINEEVEVLEGEEVSVE